jgi:hypothetical protein
MPLSALTNAQFRDLSLVAVPKSKLPPVGATLTSA